MQWISNVKYDHFAKYIFFIWKHLNFVFFLSVRKRTLPKPYWRRKLTECVRLSTEQGNVKDLEIPVLGKFGQEGCHEFNVSLGNTVSSGWVPTTSQVSVLNQEIKQDKLKQMKLYKPNKPQNIEDKHEDFMVFWI